VSHTTHKEPKKESQKPIKLTNSIPRKSQVVVARNVVIKKRMVTNETHIKVKAPTEGITKKKAAPLVTHKQHTTVHKKVPTKVVVKQVKTVHVAVVPPKGAVPLSTIKSIAKQVGLPAKAVAAMVCAESSCGRSEQWDYSGTHWAYGKTQMSYGALSEIGWVPEHIKKQPRSVRKAWFVANAPYILRGNRGVLAGALYLKNRQKAHGSVHAALRAYNQGDGGVNNSEAYRYARTSLSLAAKVYGLQ